MPVKVAPASSAKMMNLLRSLWFHPVDEDVDTTNMDAGADTPVGSAEFGHPHEHDDAEFLGPAKVEVQAANPGPRGWDNRRRSDGRRRQI